MEMYYPRFHESPSQIAIWTQTILPLTVAYLASYLGVS